MCRYLYGPVCTYWPIIPEISIHSWSLFYYSTHLSKHKFIDSSETLTSTYLIKILFFISSVISNLNYHLSISKENKISIFTSFPWHHYVLLCIFSKLKSWHFTYKCQIVRTHIVNRDLKLTELDKYLFIYSIRKMSI